MRDVKNFVCTRLDLSGLVADDFGMELLVAGKIVDLSLPVAAVYDAVWKPHLASGAFGASQLVSRALRSALQHASDGRTPMVVTYRLSGLDGEATEPVVKSLASGGEQAADPETEFAVAAVMAESRADSSAGVALLLRLLCAGGPQAAAAAPALLQLLLTACRLRSCRQALLQAPSALEMLVQKVNAALNRIILRSLATHGGATPQAAPSRAGAPRSPSDTGAAPSSSSSGQGAEAASTFAGMLSLLEVLTKELNALPADALPQHCLLSTEESARHVQQLAHGLCRLAGSATSEPLQSAAATLAHVLAALAHGNTQAQVGLVDHFSELLDVEYLDRAPPAEVERLRGELSSFVSLLESIPDKAASPTAAAASRPIPIGGSPLAAAATPTVAAVATAPALGSYAIRDLVLQRGLPGQLAAHVLRAFSLPPGDSDDGGSSGSGGGASPKRRPTEDDDADEAELLRVSGGISCRLPPTMAEPGSAAWSAATSKPGVEMSLKLLASMAQGHARCAAAVAEVPGLLQLVHALEGTAGGVVLAPLAEQLLEVLGAAGGVQLEGRVSGMRRATAQRKRLAAERSKQRMLARLGLAKPAAAAAVVPSTDAAASTAFATAPSLAAEPAAAAHTATAPAADAAAASDAPAAAASGVPAAPPGPQPMPARIAAMRAAAARPPPAMSELAKELAALEAEEGDGEEDEQYACMVCREGYRLQPAQLLGAYCYCKTLPADAVPGCLPPGSTLTHCFSTVTHFNLIHADCHQAAKAADANLRTPKREWDGATLRNGEVKCNNLLPVRAQSVSETAYAAAVSQYWDGLLQLSKTFTASLAHSSPAGAGAAAVVGTPPGQGIPGFYAGAAGGGGSGGNAALATSPSGRRLLGITASRATAGGTGSAAAAGTARAADGPSMRLSLVASDLACVLHRFAFQQSFSEDAGGGGRASNAYLLPALMQLGTYFAAHCTPAELCEHQQLIDAAVASGAAAVVGGSGATTPAGSAGPSPRTSPVKPSTSSEAAVARGFSPDRLGGRPSTSGASTSGGATGAAAAALAAPHVLALALLLQTREQWLATRLPLLRTAVRHAPVAGRAAGRLTSSSSAGLSATSPVGSPRVGVGSTGADFASGSSPPVWRLGALQVLGSGAGDDSAAAAALFQTAAPMVRFVAAVDWLQMRFKPPATDAETVAGGASSAAADSGNAWLSSLHALLQDTAQLTSTSADLLAYLSRLEAAQSAAELFDVMGLKEEALLLGAGDVALGSGSTAAVGGSSTGGSGALEAPAAGAYFGCSWDEFLELALGGSMAGRISAGSGVPTPR